MRAHERKTSEPGPAASCGGALLGRSENRGSARHLVARGFKAAVGLGRLRKADIELSSHAMRGFPSDIRYALRTVRHGGMATVVAVASLAVGIGVNAAIFSVGYVMLVRPLPY